MHSKIIIDRDALIYCGNYESFFGFMKYIYEVVLGLGDSIFFESQLTSQINSSNGYNKLKLAFGKSNDKMFMWL